MKNGIDRKDFKYNFLKSAIIRIDYTGILDLDLERTIREIQDLLYGSEFTSFNEQYISEVDFDLKDPELIETQLVIPINELKKNKAYIFENKESDITLQITKFFAIITIDLSVYKEFETFGEKFAEVIQIIKKNNKFIKLLRLGLRKINQCILLDIFKLNKYFEEKYFRNIVKDIYEGVEDVDEFNLLNSQYVDSFYIGDRDINLVRYTSKGMINLNEKIQDAYQVVLDIDIYYKEEELLQEITSDRYAIFDELKEMNNILFKFYVQVLTDDFIHQLKDTGVDEKDIIGVEKNETI